MTVHARCAVGQYRSKNRARFCEEVPLTEVSLAVGTLAAAEIKVLCIFNGLGKIRILYVNTASSTGNIRLLTLSGCHTQNSGWPLSMPGVVMMVMMMMMMMMMKWADGRLVVVLSLTLPGKPDIAVHVPPQIVVL